MLSLVFAGPDWFALILVIPVELSLVIARYRTTADADTVTARTLLGSETVRWDDIDGLRFGRRAWALARRHDGSEVVTSGSDVRDPASADGRQWRTSAQPLRVTAGCR